MGGPMPGAVNTIRYWKQRGHRIVVFTVRGDHKYIRDWLTYYHIPFDKVTNVKGPGIYLDNQAVHFDGNWNKAIALVHRLESDMAARPKF